MFFRLSHAGINANFSMDSWSFNESIAEFIEFLAKLEDRNGNINSSVLQLLKELPSIAERLLQIADQRDAFFPGTNLFKEVSGPPTNDSASAELLNRVSRRIHGILPITYALLNPFNVSEVDSYSRVENLTDRSRPKMTEFSWNSWIDYFLQVLRHTEPECFNDWACRIKKAATILNTIFHMDLHWIAESSRQGIDEFIVK